MPSVIEQAAGALLMAVVLLDVVLIVLYARAGWGILGPAVGRTVWWLFFQTSKLFGPLRGRMLSFCAPTMLILLVTVWGSALALASGLMIHPYMGTSVQATDGPTPNDFVSALYAGGNSIAVVGANEFTPRTNAFRLLFLFNSMVGMSVLSLSLTYLLQIYNALQRRNTLGLKLYTLSARTRDAAELLAGLGPQGKFSNGYTHLAEIGSEITDAKETHHFYPVLFYFRFAESFYSISMSTAMVLDCVTLIRSALDEEEYRWLRESAAVVQLWEASLLLVKMLEERFPSVSTDEGSESKGPEAVERWRRRYIAGVERLKKAGIRTTSDERAGTETYIQLRARWHEHIARLAAPMAYKMEEIDPVGTNPERPPERDAFKEQLSSVV